MPRLIDADALKKEWKMGDVCETCDQDTRQCGNDYCFSRMDVCGMIDDAPTVATDTNVLGKWISVKDRLPETRHVVLVYTPEYKNIWAASMHEDGNWYIWSPGGRVLLDPDWHGPITHWMPLPEPPEEVKQDG